MAKQSQTMRINALRVLQQQVFYAGIAACIYLVFLAIEPTKANAGATLVYSLLLCNLTTLLQNGVERRLGGKTFPVFWALYLTILLALTPVTVAIATAVIFLMFAAGGVSYWQYLASGWKFPAVATLIFGIGTMAYRYTKQQLERRNRELKQAVEMQVAELEFQDQEMERAREIQQSLLPKEIPQVPGFEIAGEWEPARVVGGDYYDVIRLSGSKLGICIADVVGKSISAALLMANVQATVRAFANDANSAAALCNRVNAVLCANIATGKFVTLFYGILDQQHGIFQYANAGHPRPILVDGRGEFRNLEDGGAILGVFPEWKYEDAEMTLRPGDRLVLFTDGITEAAKADGEEFGTARVLGVVKRSCAAPAAMIKDHLLAEVKAFCRSPLGDDATLIVIGVKE